MYFCLLIGAFRGLICVKRVPFFFVLNSSRNALCGIIDGSARCVDVLAVITEFGEGGKAAGGARGGGLCVDFVDGEASDWSTAGGQAGVLVFSCTPRR